MLAMVRPSMHGVIGGAALDEEEKSARLVRSLSQARESDNALADARHACRGASVVSHLNTLASARVVRYRHGDSNPGFRRERAAS